jgi:hypothetical protein
MESRTLLALQRSCLLALTNESPQPMSAFTGITHKITYRRPTDDTIHKLEWSCPKGWGRTAVREAFYAQFRGAEILSIEEAPCSI